MDTETSFNVNEPFLSVYSFGLYYKGSVPHYEEKKVKTLKFSYLNDAFKPTEVRWKEIPYEDINLLNELGSGAFGVVYKGELIRDKGEVTPCAVKALIGENKNSVYHIKPFPSQESPRVKRKSYKITRWTTLEKQQRNPLKKKNIKNCLSLFVYFC